MRDGAAGWREGAVGCGMELQDEGWGRRTRLHFTWDSTSPVLQAVAFLTSAPPAGKVGPGLCFSPCRFQATFCSPA